MEDPFLEWLDKYISEKSDRLRMNELSLFGAGSLNGVILAKDKYLELKADPDDGMREVGAAILEMEERE